MIAIPAVDLRGGACVQLVGRSYDHERLRFDNPQGVALGWARLGFHRLHAEEFTEELTHDTSHGPARHSRSVPVAPGLRAR